jgi:hypothetical protein
MLAKLLKSKVEVIAWRSSKAMWKLEFIPRSHKSIWQSLLLSTNPTIQPTLQHFHSTATPKKCSLMLKNHCHRLWERFSGRCVLRRTLSLSQRFVFQGQHIVDNRSLRVPNRTVNNNGFCAFLDKNRCNWLNLETIYTTKKWLFKSVCYDYLYRFLMRC